MAAFHCLYLSTPYLEAYKETDIFQQVHEGDRVCGTTVVHGTCSYFIAKLLVTESLVVLLDFHCVTPLGLALLQP